MPIPLKFDEDRTDVRLDGRDAEVTLPERLRDYGTPVPVGRGATSVVYKMIQPVRHVTKVIDCQGDAGALRSALYEARVMRRLSNCPLVVHLVDSEVVSQNGRFTVYFVEEYHKPLEEAMRERRFSAVECVGIAIGVTEALMACRAAGVLHLDVQAKNVFFTDGWQIRLGDFGCSLLVEDEDDRSRPRGTLAFMAPEVFRDRLYGERSDVYSVGILLFCLLNEGVYPFANACGVPEATYRRLAGERLPRIVRLGERQNDLVEAALDRICAFDPSMRPQSFGELRECLMALLGSLAALGEDGGSSATGFEATGSGTAMPDWDPSSLGLNTDLFLDTTVDPDVIGRDVVMDSYDMWTNTIIVPGEDDGAPGLY